MGRKNQTMTVQGYSGKNRKAIKQEQCFSDDNNPKSYGMPITPCTFWDMLNNFRRSTIPETDQFEGLAWVEFSKASIFRILSQENCDYVRFYFVIPDLDINKASLAMQGVDSDGKTIKKDTIHEVAVKMESSEFNPDNIRDEDALLESLSELPPPMEEKGNGGDEAPLTENKNVQSINDFYAEMKEKGLNFSDMDLATFAKEFLEYADRQSSIK